METVGVTKFRSNMRKYLNQAKTERILIIDKDECFELVPSKYISNDSFFNDPKVIEDIQEALVQIQAGKGHEISPEEQYELLGL